VQEPLRLEVPKRLSGTRFDRALAELVPQLSRSQLQKLVRRGRVKLDGKKILRSNMNLRGGEQLLVHMSDPHATPTAPLDFVHIDADLAVVNKPAGMLTHQTERHRAGTVSDLARERLGDLPTFDDAYRPGIVHRLDRETSGLLVIARNQKTLDALRDAFRARAVRKLYLALVYGSPESDSFESTQALGPVSETSDLQRVDPDGRPAHSQFDVRERWEQFTLLECRPTTGRRHQLRVHLHHAGLPVVGDKLYRPQHPSEAAPRLRYHALHATALEFEHPTRTERVRFEAPLPDELRAALDGLAR